MHNGEKKTLPRATVVDGFFSFSIFRSYHLLNWWCCALHLVFFVQDEEGWDSFSGDELAPYLVDGDLESSSLCGIHQIGSDSAGISVLFSNSLALWHLVGKVEPKPPNRLCEQRSPWCQGIRSWLTPLSRNPQPQISSLCCLRLRRPTPASSLILLCIDDHTRAQVLADMWALSLSCRWYHTL